MSRWIDSSVKSPKQGQWVVIPWGTGFRTGQFDRLHPFGPSVVDREHGRYWSGFTHWKSIYSPKALAL